MTREEAKEIATNACAQALAQILLNAAQTLQSEGEITARKRLSLGANAVFKSHTALTVMIEAGEIYGCS